VINVRFGETNGASSQLRIPPIMCMIVMRVPITFNQSVLNLKFTHECCNENGEDLTKHGRNIRKYNTRTVILVSVDKNPKTLKQIGRSKYRPRGSPVLCHPHRHSVAIETAFSVDVELPLQLPASTSSSTLRKNLH
jgi:hypothetical protein